MLSLTVDEAEFAAWCRANRAVAGRPNEPARIREMDDAYDRLAARIWGGPVTSTREGRISWLQRVAALILPPRPA
jgi:hypothetical protein